MTPYELLQAAFDSLNRSDGAPSGLWPRLVSLLGRQAIEEGMIRLWHRRAPGLEGCTTRAQLLCLSSYIDRGVALDTALAWSSLSHACHSHPFEIAPGAAELRHWLDQTGEFLAEIEP